MGETFYVNQFHDYLYRVHLNSAHVSHQGAFLSYHYAPKKRKINLDCAEIAPNPLVRQASCQSVIS